MIFLKFAYIKVLFAFKFYAFGRSMSWIQHYSTMQNNFTGIKNSLYVMYSTLLLPLNFWELLISLLSLILSFTEFNIIGIVTYSLFRLKKFILIFIIYIYFWLYLASPWILVPGSKPEPCAMEAWSLNHWTTREVPKKFIFILQIWKLHLFIWMCQIFSCITQIT